VIDRLDEAERLTAAADGAPQLVVMRGRRRVGKSYLIDHTLGARRGLFFQADEQDEAGQLDLFAKEAAALLPGSPPLRFDSWDDALRFLGAQAADGALVVTLDEFQWLWSAQPALDSIIQRHWDTWQRDRTPVTLVLCGSALGRMEDLVAARRPLYGRADYRPLLQPLDYRWAAEFAPANATAEQRLRRWAVLGGVPQYQVWAGTAPLRDVIAERILRRGESLYEEPLHLLREEQTIRTPGTYFRLVHAIARGATQHGEIANAARLDTPNMTKMLERLEDLGYVERRAPLSPAGFAPKRSVYRLSDPFMRFWFRYVFPNRSRLERGRVSEVLAAIEADLDTYMGLAFEDCCRIWLSTYAPEQIGAGITEVGGWWHRTGTPEVDVVALRERHPPLLGSCKWSAAAPSNVLGVLRRDRDALLGAGHDAQLLVFARGFSDELVAHATREDVRLISASDLFPDSDAG
jgi:AAA+ ATPase superfamily predicted ATPase